MTGLLLDVAVRAVLIAAGTGFILWALRIRAASGRHAAWTTVIVAMLLLPLWSLAGPRLPLPVLPSISSAAAQPAGNPNLQDPPAGETWGIIGDGIGNLGGSAVPVMWVMLAVHAIGVLVLLARLVIGTIQARRLRRTATMRAGRYTSARCATPITVGWLSPTLILPEGWDRWPAARLDAVLTHEGAHARRRDPLVQWLALLNRAFFWFHPLAWWLERRVAALAEEACDAAVIRAGHSPQDYCDYLIDMARTLARKGRRLNVVGMAMPGSGLPDRMRHIFEEAAMKPLSRARLMSTLAFCIIASIGMAAVSLAPQKAAAGDAARHEMVFVPKVDLSGEWVQVDWIYNGAGRGGGSGSGERRMVSISSGAAVNCGTTCTIIQDGSTLRLIRPDQPGVLAPDSGDITLNTDGSESTISQKSGGGFKALAKWNGE